MLPCYAVPFSGSPPTELHHPPCPPYQHPFHQSSLDPGPSEFGHSTSALRLNSNQRSRPPLSNCVDLAILSVSTGPRSSEPLQREPSSRTHDPLLFPILLLLRHRIAFHDISGKPHLGRTKALHLGPKPGVCAAHLKDTTAVHTRPLSYPETLSAAFRQPCCADLLPCDSSHIDFLVTPAAPRDAPRWPGNPTSSGAVIPNTSEYYSSQPAGLDASLNHKTKRNDAGSANCRAKRTPRLYRHILYP